MISNGNIRAIIWDYDGTLVDTRLKNLNVTRRIIESIVETGTAEFSALQSLENYHLANRRASNWRELYRLEFDLTEEQIDEAGRLWTEFQLTDNTDAYFFDGVERVIRALEGFPHGIVSQNSKRSITRNLEKTELLPFFGYIVGYEEVDLKRQKPEPDGLLRCMEKLSKFEPGCVCYIGDHETDAQCAARANRVLADGEIDMKIISIGAFYDVEPNLAAWQVRPDYEAQRVDDILDIVNCIK